MRNRSFPWVWAAISVVAIAAIVVSVLPGTGLLPAAATPTARNTSTPSTTPTVDACAPQNVQPVALEFNAFAREFDDYSAIAENTPSQNLAEPIAELQRIRRNSESFETPVCLAALKELQLGYMNSFINALITLFSIETNREQMTQEQFNEIVFSVNRLIAQALQYHEQYLDEMARIMGVTRVPSPTVPSGTLDPEGPLPEGTATATP